VFFFCLFVAQSRHAARRKLTCCLGFVPLPELATHVMNNQRKKNGERVKEAEHLRHRDSFPIHVTKTEPYASILFILP
jgi:hypothetical protein